MGPIEKTYRDNGVVRLRVDSGGTEFRVTAEREITDGPRPRPASVRYASQGPVSPRQADDFAALLRHAAQEARA